MFRIAMLTALVATGLAVPSPAGATTTSDPANSDPTTSDPAKTTLNGADVKRIRNRHIRIPGWKVALRYAMDKRGTPYVWGGASRSGYDCSGLMLRAYQAAGIRLPRTAAEQYRAFARKISWAALKPGDLVFFSGLGHVGMISRPGHMVHSPHTGDVVKEERLSEWRRNAFVGAVRPDPKGVKRWAGIREKRRAPAPAMLTATL